MLVDNDPDPYVVAQDYGYFVSLVLGLVIWGWS